MLNVHVGMYSMSTQLTACSGQNYTLQFADECAERINYFTLYHNIICQPTV